MKIRIQLGDDDKKQAASDGGGGVPPPMVPVEAPDAFDLALARTAYNYMRTYPNLEAVPLCASVPESEAFSTDYNALVLRSSAQIADNFLKVATALVEEEVTEDSAFWRANKLLMDIKTAVEGMKEVSSKALAYGPTAFLKSTLWDVLRPPAPEGFGTGFWAGLRRALFGDKDFLQATSEQDYADLIVSLPPPLMLTIPEADWMPEPEKDPDKPHDLPCEQDWFFGWLQVAGFNTTNLRGVVLQKDAASKAILLADLQKKMVDIDKIFKSVTGATMTLEQAAASGNIYACDYSGLLGEGAGSLPDRQSRVHGQERYLPGPIALFYWNQSEKSPDGYPPGYRHDGSATDGVLQPFAIQLSPEPGSTIFTPNNCEEAGAKDKNGWKWRIAKYFVNVACAIQHESVAHLGDCHFIIESITIATHRQLWGAPGKEHPVYKLLAPHLRFTLSINAGALSNLVVPGGVVATNVGPDIHWTLTMVNEARKAWRWNENNPETLFALRGVDASKPLVFPFRDDTLLLWKATQQFVQRYVDLHYQDDAAVQNDVQLSAWFDEMTSPQHADFKGLERATTREALAGVLAQIIYTAGPLHASVNYAQYPLGAFMPSVAATIYRPAPTADTQVDKKNYLQWCPPLDIALYTLSFEYLLSSIQYDVFGHYADNPQFPYFENQELQQALEDFQADLMKAELEIMARNRKRPMAYPFQLPSKIPNSISI
jgi:arachidonate 15-lipoxygenase